MRLDQLLKFNDIIIQCHDSPDADSIAAGFALYTYLKDNGKSPRLVYSGEKEITKPSLMLMQEKLNIPLEYVRETEKPELLITVDCVYGERNVSTLPAHNYAAIDHHKQNIASDDFVEIRSSYGSCSAVIAEMIHDQGLNVNEHLDVATALYYGLFMDTNAFSEIDHPADKDLRDFAIYDMQLIQLLKNSNISIEELAIAGDAMQHVYYNLKHKFAVTEAKPCDPNILGIISDLLIQVTNVDVCVVCSKSMRHGIKYSVRSFIKDMKADELAKIIADGVGNGGGHSRKAGGFIRSDDIGDTDIVGFLIKRIINAYESYSSVFSDRIDKSKYNFGRYKRRPQTLGYLKTTDIIPSGGKICIRTLKADRNIISDDKMYILVKDSGSIRTIERNDFDNIFERSDEPFNFSKPPEYSPHIIGADISDNVAFAGNIIRLAKKCCNNDINVYLAHKLTENIKLYKKYDDENYTVGHSGDYLVLSSRERDAVYIVPEQQFLDEYEESE